MGNLSVEKCTRYTQKYIEYYIKFLIINEKVFVIVFKLETYTPTRLHVSGITYFVHTILLCINLFLYIILDK